MIERFQTDNERLQKELELIKRTLNMLPELQKRRAELQSDQLKFRELIDKTVKYKKVRRCPFRHASRFAHVCSVVQGLEAKLAEREAERERTQRELVECETERASLQQQVSQQKITPLEVQKMSQERQLLEEGLQRCVSRLCSHATRTGWRAHIHAQHLHAEG